MLLIDIWTAFYGYDSSYQYNENGKYAELKWYAYWVGGLKLSQVYQLV